MRLNTLLAIILSGTVAAHAADYQYLNIEKTDGTAQSLTAVGLSIYFEDGRLVATNGSETATFALTDISSMFFSNSKDVTAIADISSVTDDGEATVYDLTGRQVAEGRMQDVKMQLHKGIYIVKLNSNSLKVQVK